MLVLLYPSTGLDHFYLNLKAAELTLQVGGLFIHYPYTIHTLSIHHPYTIYALSMQYFWGIIKIIWIYFAIGPFFKLQYWLLDESRWFQGRSCSYFETDRDGGIRDTCWSKTPIWVKIIRPTKAK